MEQKDKFGAVKQEQQLEDDTTKYKNKKKSRETGVSALI